MALNRVANYMTAAHIPDLNSGLRAFRRDIAMQYFTILPDQFSFTTTITLAMHCDKYAVTYLPIDYPGAAAARRSCRGTPAAS